MLNRISSYMEIEVEITRPMPAMGKILVSGGQFISNEEWCMREVLRIGPSASVRGVDGRPGYITIFVKMDRFRRIRRK